MSAKFVARSHELEWRQVDEEVVILDLRTQTYLSLNHSGARLWPLLTAGAPRHALVDELVAAYQVDRARASGDVDQLVAQLAAADLLEEVGGAPAEP